MTESVRLEDCSTDDGVVVVSWRGEGLVMVMGVFSGVGLGLDGCDGCGCGRGQGRAGFVRKVCADEE